MMKKAFIYGLFAVNLAIIVFSWSRSSFSLLGEGWPSAFLSIGRLAGLLAVFFVLLQFVLIGRNPSLEKTFGLDRLAIIHHLNGFLALLFIFSHFILIFASYALINQINVIQQFFNFLSYDGILKAFIALLIFIGIVFLSITIVRKRFKYEMWYFTHFGTYVAVLFAWGHQLEIGGDFAQNPLFVGYWYALYAVVLGEFLIWRFLRPIFLFYRHRFFVSRVISENDSVVSIYISGRDISKFKILAGQFMILRFLSRQFFWQAHPFSLSFAPQNNELRITVKSVGDFTSQIKNVTPGTKIFIDGPYGIFTEKVAKHDKFLFLAGGIGITPIWALVETLAQKNKDMILIYGNKTEKDIVFADKLKHFASRVYHVLSDSKNENYEHGYIDEEKLKRLAPDFREREIFLCGPPVMMRSLIKILRNLGVNKGMIHYEKFSLQ